MPKVRAPSFSASSAEKGGKAGMPVTPIQELNQGQRTTSWYGVSFKPAPARKNRSKSLFLLTLTSNCFAFNRLRKTP